MVNCLQQLCANAPLASTRAFAPAVAMWHRGTVNAIPTVGTGFKPYDQRPKERLL